MFRRSTDPTPAHWSKAFVEHLRTVHFTLTGLCVGLMVILMSPTFDARKAASQMATIMRVVNHWHDIDKQMSAVNGSMHPDDIILQGSSINLVGSIFSNIQFNFHSSSLVYICRSRTFVQGPTLTPLDEYRPTSLQQFVDLWNVLRAPTVILRPVSIGRKALVYPHDNSKPFTIRLETAVAKNPGPVALDFDLHPSTTADCDPNVRKYREVVFTVNDPPGAREIAIVVNAVNQQVLSHALSDAGFVLHATGPQDRDARSFSQAFPDLATAASGRYEEDLEVLSRQIYDESSKGADSFEAFGMKFPSNQVTRWGIILIICVQLYFLAYLIHFYKTLQPDDEGWNTPWIGMSESALARILLFATVVILPLATAWILIRQAELADFVHPAFDFGHDTVFNKSHYRFTLAGAGLCAGLALLCWLYRPRLASRKHKKIPSQRFE